MFNFEENLVTMKRKFGIITAIVLFSLAIAASSCRSTNNCPAYSKAKIEHTHIKKV